MGYSLIFLTNFKIPVSLYTLKSVGIDPGFSSSATGIVVLEHIKPELKEDKIRVIESHLIENGDPNQIVNLCWVIWKKHAYLNTVFWIDGSNSAMVNLLKIRWDESLSWETSQLSGPNTKIRPVNFSTEHRNMLSNLHAIISKGYSRCGTIGCVYIGKRQPTRQHFLLVLIARINSL